VGNRQQASEDRSLDTHLVPLPCPVHSPSPIPYPSLTSLPTRCASPFKFKMAFGARKFGLLTTVDSADPLPSCTAQPCGSLAIAGALRISWVCLLQGIPCSLLPVPGWTFLEGCRFPSCATTGPSLATDHVRQPTVHATPCHVCLPSHAILPA